MELAQLLSQVESRLRLRAQLEGGRLSVPIARSLARLLESQGTGEEGRRKVLEEVAREVQGCRACGLSRFRNSVVVGEGNPRAELVFVGEGPGEEEDLQGRPFVGPAGQLLDRIIEGMGLSRQEVFIANVVKCRPPANRTPKPEEVEACLPFLLRQLRAISPRVICTLGAVAAQALLGAAEGITRLRGQFQTWEGTPVMPTYHPSYLLRYPSKKRDVWEDMKRILGLLGRPIPKGRSSGKPASQEGGKHD